MNLECNMVKVMDSINFLPFPLAALPKAFGFTEQKGYFPHLFNKECNTNYIGEYPAIEYYCPEDMKDATDFKLWYESVRRLTFNMNEQLISYCNQDVTVLKHGELHNTHSNNKIPISRMHEVSRDDNGSIQNGPVRQQHDHSIDLHGNLPIYISS